MEIRLVAPITKEPVQLIDAKIQIGNELNFMQKFMTEWFYTSAMTSVIIIMLSLFSVQIITFCIILRSHI